MGDFFRGEIIKLGYAYPANGYDFNEDGNLVENRIDDVELAHDMALAENPHREKAARAKEFYTHLQQSPDRTFTRTGKRKRIFEELIEARKAEDADNHSDYYAHSAAKRSHDAAKHSTESYIFAKNDQYLTELNYPPTIRITNGFVAHLHKPSIEQSLDAASLASRIVFFKHKTKENIALFEENLSEHEVAVFAPIEDADDQEIRRRKSDSEWLRDDQEALSLKQRSRELYDIYSRKIATHAIASTFGIELGDGDMSRENFVKLTEAVNESRVPFRR